MSCRAPERLTADHQLAAFSSSEPSLNEWLIRRAIHNQTEGHSRTYVLCPPRSMAVVGYYCLATGSVQRTHAPRAMRQNAPDPLPVMVLGRLAITESHQAKGYGKALLRDAIERTLAAGEIAGMTAMLVHALSEGAVAFYSHMGFKPSPMNPMTLMLSLKEIARARAAGAPLGGE